MFESHLQRQHPPISGFEPRSASRKNPQPKPHVLFPSVHKRASVHLYFITIRPRSALPNVFQSSSTIAAVTCSCNLFSRRPDHVTHLAMGGRVGRGWRRSFMCVSTGKCNHRCDVRVQPKSRPGVSLPRVALKRYSVPSVLGKRSVPYLPEIIPRQR